MQFQAFSIKITYVVHMDRLTCLAKTTMNLYSLLTYLLINIINTGKIVYCQAEFIFNTHNSVA